ncbi:cell division protein ZipA [Wenzhouxiangella sp. AB-CW3]|uniref:cell division protein ZipA n=1 Tax=Wenzhouxiangella sp. AB-CW3 TaxID=2771012 RepID=UPI00168BDCF4|nr:cell division protein ZipA [Wenzhouxiangella sp. AB-CW3]QOC23977.1 cell division protein ZipA [Wenzhouxiangella sp. AB-CW3]
MDNLRLILILAGIVILALIVLLHKPAGESRRNHARWRDAHRERREPSLGEEEADSVPENPPGDTAALWEGDRPERDRGGVDGPESSVATTNDPGNPDKIIYLYIRRRDERRINGSELLDAALKAGLTFGDMNIFHRVQEGVRQPVFSMANLTKPGHFDSGAWNVFDTPGVTLFLTLPAPVSALDAWDAMHATAQRLGELLEADVLDDGQCLLTRQRIAQIREEMREYDRTHGLLGARKGLLDGG